MKKKSLAQILSETRQYIEFLKKRLESKNYKNNVSKEEFDKTKEKYEKAKLRLKILGK